MLILVVQLLIHHCFFRSKMSSERRREILLGLETDLLNCSACSFIYDPEVRKPKSLPCSHSVCLPCLKVNTIN